VEQSPFWEAKSFSAHYGTGRFIVAFTTAHRLSQCWARWILSISQSYFFKIDFIIILLAKPGFSKWSLYLRFFHQDPVCTVHIPLKCWIPSPSSSHACWFNHPVSIWWEVQVLKLLTVQLSPFPWYLVPLSQCFSTAGPRPGTGPWHQLNRPARGSPGICHFSFLNNFHE